MYAMSGSVRINLSALNNMKLNIWIILIALIIMALLLTPRVSGFLYDSGGDYNVVWPRAYNNWVNMRGYIDVPTGGKC
jgi:hypothetical protein